MKILVKTPNWLGDAVMGLPTLRSLRDMEPRAHLAVLTRRSLASLYSAVPYVDETIPYPRPDHGRLFGWLDIVKELKGRRFDVALVLPRSFSSALMVFTARIPRRIGYGADARSAMLTDAIPRDRSRIHRVHYYHRLLETIGKPPPPAPPCLEVPAAADAWARDRLASHPAWTAINPGATYGEAKQWAPERFIDVGLRLAGKDRGVVVIGGPAEAELGSRVARGIGRSSVSLAGATDIPQLAAVLQRCDLLLTNDTGPMHVADAVGCPIVAVFGPTDWMTTPPYGPRHAIVRKEMECSPCLKRSCPLKHHHCMKWITADEVADACGRLLERPR